MCVTVCVCVRERERERDTHTTNNNNNNNSGMSRFIQNCFVHLQLDTNWVRESLAFNATSLHVQTLVQDLSLVTYVYEIQKQLGFIVYMIYSQAFSSCLWRLMITHLKGIIVNTGYDLHFAAVCHPRLAHN